VVDVGWGSGRRQGGDGDSRGTLGGAAGYGVMCVSKVIGAETGCGVSQNAAQDRMWDTDASN
jgi:hypothetical protein